MTSYEIPDKSLRLLPRITGESFRLSWAAAAPLMIAGIALNPVNGARVQQGPRQFGSARHRTRSRTCNWR